MKFNISAAYLLVINLIAFATYGIDKYKAKKQKWRVKEATLFLLAALGGSIGAFIAMYLFHHKTKKFYFVIGIPLILLLQLALGGYIILKLRAI